MENVNEIAAQLSGALGLVADLRVSASIVVLALILWVGWQLFTRSRGAADRLDPADATPTPSAQETPVPHRADAVTDDSAHQAPAPGFRVRWDRTVLAIGGLALILVFLVTGVAAAFGAATAGVAGWSLLGAAGCVAGLRVLAVRDRQARRAAAASAETTSALAEERDEAPAAVRRRATEVFDAGAFDAAEPTAELGDTQALAAEPARVETDVEQVPAEQVPSPAEADAERFETVAMPSVPRPTYLDAPEAVRPTPAPLERETVTASTDAKLKDGVSAEHRERVLAQARLRDEDDEAVRSEQVAALDLDNVLARRRAS